MMEILINSSKNKISNKSYQIAINKIEKDIDQAVSMVTDIKLNKINFIQLGEIFALLKIFRELFPIDNTNRTREKRFQNYREIKMELKSIKSQEKRKKKEVEFYEQLWMTLNPDNKADIRADTTREFLKILFSPLSSSIDEISLILSKFLQASFFLNSNNENSKMIISPITEKSISEEDLWPIDKLVREFLNLKENLLAYQRIHNYTNRAIENINKDRKDWTFKPSIPGINTKYSEIDFEDRISKFIESKKDKLGKMSKEIEEQVKKDFITFRKLKNAHSSQISYPSKRDIQMKKRKRPTTDYTRNIEKNWKRGISL